VVLAAFRACGALAGAAGYPAYPPATTIPPSLPFLRAFRFDIHVRLHCALWWVVPLPALPATILHCGLPLHHCLSPTVSARCAHVLLGSRRFSASLRWGGSLDCWCSVRASVATPPLLYRFALS